MTRRRLSALASILIALALFGVWGLFRETRVSAPDRPAEQVHVVTYATTAERARAPGGRRAERETAVAPREVPSRDLLNGVHVEPEVACRGEDVVVRTELHDHARGSRVVTAGSNGTVGVVRFDEVGVHEVSAVANAWETATDLELGAVEIVPCEEERSIEVEVLHGAQDRVHFRAHSPSGLDPVAYDWDFGDGATQRGAEANVTHDYTWRPQDEPGSSFLVTVVARDRSGAEATRRAAVHLVNDRFMARRLGHPILPARGALHPRREEGAWVLPIELGSLAGKGPTELAEVRTRALPCDGSPARERSFGADEVLGATRVAEGHQENELRFDDDSFPPGTCDVEVRLVGRAGDLEVEAVLPMRVGTPPDAERIRGEDAARIFAALDERGSDHLTRDELEGVLRRP